MCKHEIVERRKSEEPEPEKRMVRLRVLMCSTCVARLHRQALDSVYWCSECIHFGEWVQPEGQTMNCPLNTKKRPSDKCQEFELAEVPEI